jgi:hypothetical protein
MFQNLAVSLSGEQVRAVAVAPGGSHPFSFSGKDGFSVPPDSGKICLVDYHQVDKTAAATAKTNKSHFVTSKSQNATACRFERFEPRVG